MLSCYLDTRNNSVPITLILETEYSAWLNAQTDFVQTYVKSYGFSGKSGQHCLLFDAQNKLQRVIVIYNAQLYKNEYLGNLSLSLPQGHYHLENFATDPLVHLGWGMGAYQFTRYKKPSRDPAKLYIPAELKSINAKLEAIYLIRDLINTPTEHMGPQQLADTAQTIAKQHHATFTVIDDQKILAEQFPAVYTVGKASEQKPRFIELTWGKPQQPHITLIGKGVCFDTGGLDIKPDTNMRLMKKDMAGAAHVLGLAQWIMSEKLPIYLRVLVPAVENSISGNAMRPGDIIRMRNQKTVEVDNTDAEGRLILADALTYATEKSTPELLFTFATLTGAARVAVGTEISAYFTNNENIVNSFNNAAKNTDDPVWQQPLYQPYAKSLQTPFADLKNTGSSFGGAITAALFLEQFIVGKPTWLHLDIMAWNERSRPAHPEGGEAMGIAAAFELIKQRS